MNCACEEPSLLCWLATHSWLVIVWKILASCIQLACTCYRKLTCVLDFLGGNKETNKTKTPNFIIYFWMACLISQLLFMKQWFITGNYIHYSIRPYVLAKTELHLLQYT